MMTLLKNIACFSPHCCGKKDIFIAGSRIGKIAPAGSLKGSGLIERTLECEGLLAFPGLIDSHAHIAGGGGEQGFTSRAPEIHISEILESGVTTLVGLLGADGCTRSLEDLYAKAKSLELLGITTYIYSGSYGVPVVTFTGSIKKDLVFIDKVIGVGEIAISDHRSSLPNLDEMKKLSSDAHLGGMIGNKAVVVHIHVGDGKSGLQLLYEVLENSDLPIGQFVPTHVNRNPRLFAEAVEYGKRGGNIDLTASEKDGVSVEEAVGILRDEGVDLSRITVSSDANGSFPGGGVAKIRGLYDDLILCITKTGLKPETAFGLATGNAAKILKLPQKGTIREGGDADLLITSRDYRIVMLFSMGKMLIENGRVIKGGEKE